MSADFLDGLAADAAPVTPSSLAFAIRIGCGALLSAAVIIGVSGVRSDFLTAPESPIFMWKFLSMLTIAIAALTLLYRAGRPGASTRRLAKLPVAIAVTTLLLPLLLLALIEPAQTRDIRAAAGFYCLRMTSLAAIPVWLSALSWLRTAAPTNLARASWAAGTASAAVAATSFVLHCPNDVIPYVTVWYGSAILGIAALTRLVLPRLIRW